MPIPKPIDALRLAFGQAIEFFQRKDIVTPDAWALLDAKAKTRAFTVAGVSRVNVLSDAWRAIDSAIVKGTDFRTFQQEIGPALLRTWGGSVTAPNWRMETIFRNNVQAAYSAGRYEVTSNPDIVSLRPFQLFDAIMDSRTSAVCNACDGTVLPVGDPWWSSHRPPCHHACRSGTISLSVRQADKRGVSKERPTIDAAEGFGGPPDLAPVKPSKATPPELAAAAQRIT